MKTAYEAMLDILNTNETLESIKNRNMGDQPDLIDMRSIAMLENYRDLLIEEMKVSPLEVYTHDNQQYTV